MAGNVTDLELDDGGMLRGESAQAVVDIDTLTPLSGAEEEDAQQRWGGDFRQWPTIYQQRWLRRYNENDREEYVDARTWKLYQIMLNGAAAGLSTSEEDKAIRDLESLTRRFKSTSPSDWPPLARRRHIQSLKQSRWRAELERTKPARPRARGKTPCDACQLNKEAAYCDADLDLRVGCSPCRQRKRRCQCNGRRLIDRPRQDRNLRLKCRPCRQSGDDCEWLADPINLHCACRNCTRKGAECRAQEDGSSDFRPAPQRGMSARDHSRTTLETWVSRTE